jgi:hypothetical protein
MGRFLVAGLLVFLAGTARADGAKTRNAASRPAILVAAGCADLLAGGWQVYELASGERSLMASGLTMVGAAPAAAYGAILVADDPSDVLAWGVTVTAVALFAKATIDVVSAHRVIDHAPQNRVGGPNISLAPTVLFDAARPQPALAVLGSF